MTNELSPSLGSGHLLFREEAPNLLSDFFQISIRFLSQEFWISSEKKNAMENLPFREKESEMGHLLWSRATSSPFVLRSVGREVSVADAAN